VDIGALSPEEYAAVIQRVKAESAAKAEAATSGALKRKAPAPAPPAAKLVKSETETDKRAFWSAEEDAELARLRRTHDDWGPISVAFSTDRSVEAIQNRWYRHGSKAAGEQSAGQLGQAARADATQAVAAAKWEEVKRQRKAAEEEEEVQRKAVRAACLPHCCCRARGCGCGCCLPAAPPRGASQ
jgi:hypothetical protein